MDNVKIFIRGEDPDMYGRHDFELENFGNEEVLSLDVGKEIYEIISNAKLYGTPIAFVTLEGAGFIDPRAICMEQ